MAARLGHPQYSKRRVGEPLRAYAQRVNAKYDNDWAATARERKAQHAARLPTPEDHDDAARRAIEADAARWKLQDDDVWLVRARLAHGGQRRPRPPQQRQQRPRRSLNLEYPEAQSLSDCESDSGSESDHLMPDCDSDSDEFSSELSSETRQAWPMGSSSPVATEPLRTKRRREDEDDLTTNTKRHKTQPTVGQAELIRTSLKRRRDDEDDEQEGTKRSFKRQRMQPNPPSPPTDPEPALAAIPSPTSDDFSHKISVSRKSTKGMRAKPVRSNKAGLATTGTPARDQKRISRSSKPSKNDHTATDSSLPQTLLQGSRITRRSGSTQLYQLDDRGRPMLQRTVARVPRP